MNKDIEAGLQPLLGLTIWDSMLAAGMIVFDLGEERSILNHWGEMVAIGTYQLHVQATWRIRDPHRIIVASGDNYDEEGETESNLLIHRLQAFWAEHNEDRLRIEWIIADDLGGLIAYLSKGLVLEIFPDASIGEYWRYLPTLETEPHIVMTEAGLDTSA